MLEKREEFGKKYIYSVLAFWAGTEVLFSSNLDKIFVWKTSLINDLMAYIILVLLMVQIVLFQKYQFQELVIIFLFSIPIIYATIRSNHNVIMSTWIFIIASKYVDFNKIVELLYNVELAMTILVVFLYESGFIDEFTIYRGSIIRHSMGFSHPNQLGVRVFVLLACRCYIRANKFNLIDWGLILVAAMFVNIVPNSQTSYYALVLLAVIMAFYVLMYSIDGNLSVFSSFMIFIAAGVNVFSVVLSVINLRQYPFLLRVNNIMSNRFYQCYRTFKYYGIKLFGQEVLLVFSKPAGRLYRFWLDNSYMTLLIRYGIIVYLLFSILYIITMLYLKRYEQHLLVAILCLYSIYGIMENSFFSMSQNFFLLLLSYFIYRQPDIVGNGSFNKPRIKISW